MRKLFYGLTFCILIACLFIPYKAKIEINPITTEAFLVRRAIIGSYEYGVDYSASDQGAATATNNRTIKDFVDAIGSTKNAIITLRHNSGGNTTTYTLTTTEVITSNIMLKPEIGAIISDGGGAADLTINGPFEAGNYKVFDWTGTGTITIPNIRKLHGAWTGAAPDGSTDSTTAVNLIFEIAKNSLGAVRQDPGGSWERPYGGMMVEFDSGQYILSGLVEFPDSIIIQGAGQNSTTFISSFDGQIMRNENMTGLYGYDAGSLRDFSIRGDRTKVSQIGLDLLRDNFTTIENVRVTECGSHGIILRQATGTVLISVMSDSNVGDGLVIQGGVIDWAGMVASGISTNGVQGIGVKSSKNDGAGLRLHDANGCTIQGFFQYSYDASGDNSGHNVIIEGSSRQNTLIPWCEGPVEAHIYCNLDDLNWPGNTLLNMVHIADGVAGTVDRAVICNKGNLIIKNPMGYSVSYKTLNGSNAPFRCHLVNNGKIFIEGGYEQNETLLIEDENGNVGNLASKASQHYQAPDGTTYTYGAEKHYTDYNQATLNIYRTGGVADASWESDPFFRINPVNRGIELGGGAAAVDCNLYRNAANQLKTSDQLECADGIVTKVKAGAIDNNDFVVDTDGTLGVDSTNGRLYFRHGGAWHYCAQDAGFQINTKDKVCTICGKEIKPNEFVIGQTDKTMADGAVHGEWVHLKCAIKKDN